MHVTYPAPKKSKIDMQYINFHVQNCFQKFVLVQQTIPKTVSNMGPKSSSWVDATNLELFFKEN